MPIGIYGNFRADLVLHAVLRFVVRSPCPRCAGKTQEASYGPQIIRTAGIEAFSGNLRSQNAARVFSKRRPNHSDARVSFSLYLYFRSPLANTQLRDNQKDSKHGADLDAALWKNSLSRGVWHQTVQGR